MSEKIEKVSKLILEQLLSLEVENKNKASRYRYGYMKLMEMDTLSLDFIYRWCVETYNTYEEFPRDICDEMREQLDIPSVDPMDRFC